MSFPVAMFHYFNQPEYYEDYVTKLKQTVFPPVNKQRDDELKDAIKKIQQSQDLRILQAMEQGSKQ